MNKPTENSIEKYVRYPSKMSREEKARIKEWIEKDEEIRLLTEWYREFYNEIDDIKTQQNRPKPVPPVIHLSPFKNQSRYSNGFILAAQTPVSRKKRSGLKTIKTFVSEEHKTLIRILHDDDERQSKLFVISELMNEDDIVLMSARDDRSCFVSSPGGMFIIPDHEISKERMTNWSQLKLYLPVAKIHVYRDQDTGNINIDTSAVDKNHQQISVATANEMLEISTDFGNEVSPQRLVLKNQHQSLFHIMKDGFFKIPIPDLMESNSVIFFYN